ATRRRVTRKCAERTSTRWERAPMIETQLLRVPTAPRPELEPTLHFGGLYPRLQISLNTPAESRPRTAVVFIHPAGNFLQQPNMRPLTERGFATIGICTR